jgi:hypothetical protein
VSDETAVEVIVVPNTQGCSYCEAAGEVYRETPFKCLKCKTPFCEEHASPYSPRYCHNCLKQISVLIDKYVRELTVWNPRTEQWETERQACRRIRLDGPDYIWFTYHISQLTEEQLAQHIEFHKSIIQLIENEHHERIVKINADAMKVARLKGLYSGKKVQDTPTIPKVHVKQKASVESVIAKTKGLSAKKAASLAALLNEDDE